MLSLPTGAAGSVRARFLYEDRIFNASGWTGELRLRPIAGARALLETEGGQGLSTGTTDASGEVLFTQNLLDAYPVRVRVEARDGGMHLLRVVRSSGSLYTLLSDTVIHYATANVVVEVVAPYKVGSQRSIGGAFNIYDVIYRGMEKLAGDFGATGFPLLAVYWQVGSTDGTYYSHFDHSMHLYGTTEDTDEYDDAIVVHEFGHYVADVFSRDDSSGGPHYLNREYPLPLSWSEGVAHYISSLLRENPQHLDTYGDVDYLTFNLETVHAGLGPEQQAAVAPGAGCELRVAAALWDVTDATGDDPEAASEEDFWRVFHEDLPVAASRVTMESFFLAWRARWANREDWPLFLDVLSGQGIYYFDDALEPNNAAGKASLISRRLERGRLTFFGAGDEDWFSVPVTLDSRYIFETDNLHNGADTVLALLDETGSAVLAQNDNAGQQDSPYDSRILWTSDRTGVVRLRVRHVTSTWQASFGSYELLATYHPDRNGDGEVDTVDLTPWVTHMPDFNLDGVIDYVDWFEFSRAWGE